MAWRYSPVFPQGSWDRRKTCHSRKRRVTDHKDDKDRFLLSLSSPHPLQPSKTLMWNILIYFWMTYKEHFRICVRVCVYIYLSLFDEVACSIFMAVTTRELCVERKWCHVVNSSLCHTKHEAWVIKKIFTAFNYSMFKMWSRNKELFVVLRKGEWRRGRREKYMNASADSSTRRYFNEKLKLSRSPGWSEEMCIKRAHFVSAPKQSY